MVKRAVKEKSQILLGSQKLESGFNVWKKKMK